MLDDGIGLPVAGAPLDDVTDEAALTETIADTLIALTSRPNVDRDRIVKCFQAEESDSEDSDDDNQSEEHGGYSPTGSCQNEEGSDADQDEEHDEAGNVSPPPS